MTEEVRWTAAGKAALADIRGEVYRDTKEAELRAMVAKGTKRFAPAWKRGLPKADDEGTAAYELAAKTLVKGTLPKKPSVDDAARLLSLFGASESALVCPLGELFIRAHGLGIAIDVSARMWSHRSAYNNPDWPKSEKRLAVWITAIEDDDNYVHDASVSYSKAAFSGYLQRRYATGTAGERAEMKKGVTAIWKTTTPHARPALAYSTNDAKRAKESAEELIHAGESPWPFFAWGYLPYIVKDAELAIRILRDNNLSVRLIENLGVAVWPLYEERIAQPMDGRSRARILEQLANFYGPRTALIMGEYEDTKDCMAIVREYFTLYPELLDKIIDEPALKYHRDDLLKLRVTDKPVPGRRRS